MLRLDAIVYTLVNLLILYAGLRHFLIKPIQSVMEQRKSMIEKQFSEAKETMDEANRQKNDYEDLLKGVKGMVQDIKKTEIGCIIFGKDTGIRESFCPFLIFWTSFYL